MRVGVAFVLAPALKAFSVVVGEKVKRKHITSDACTWVVRLDSAGTQQLCLIAAVCFSGEKVYILQGSR